jgi:hypothetical protein
MDHLKIFDKNSFLNFIHKPLLHLYHQIEDDLHDQSFVIDLLLRNRYIYVILDQNIKYL